MATTIRCQRPRPTRPVRARPAHVCAAPHLAMLALAGDLGLDRRWTEVRRAGHPGTADQSPSTPVRVVASLPKLDCPPAARRIASRPGRSHREGCERGTLMRRVPSTRLPNGRRFARREGRALPPMSTRAFSARHRERPYRTRSSPVPGAHWCQEQSPAARTRS